MIVMVKKDFPMQRFIIKKSLDLNSNFIKHYKYLIKRYSHSEDIISESMSLLRANLDINLIQK